MLDEYTLTKLTSTKLEKSDYYTKRNGACIVIKKTNCEKLIKFWGFVEWLTK